MDAIRKLPPRKNRRKNKHIDILVIRTTKAGKLANSKPCTDCLHGMSNVRGYFIDSVYYSTAEGEIVCHKLSDLIAENDKHVAYRKRQKCH